MDIQSILAALRSEKERLDEAILTIERLASGTLGKRRGRASEVDGQRQGGRRQVTHAQETAEVQRGDTKTHGGITAQAMGGPESLDARGLKSVGLCFDCKHARVMRSDRGSVFYLCSLSATDPSFAKYPRLPVLSCPGYQHRTARDNERPPN